MPGSGRKTFSAGSVLTASDVMNYLQDQAVMVFGGTAARSSAIPSPSEGMVTYRTDDNALEYYDGTSWTSALNPTINNQTGTTYTFVATDNGKLITANNSGAQTFTVPPQSSVAWPTGSILSVISYGTGTVTFAGGVGVTVTNTANTLSQYQGASLVRTGSDAWTVVPFSGGANALNDASVTGTTGSPTTGTYTDSGINYKFYSFTGSGSITTNKAGLIDVLLVGGGGGAGAGISGGGGAGGHNYQTSFYLPSGTTTVTVGGGGAVSYNGNDTRLLTCIGIGGGAGATGNYTALSGGSAGGGANGFTSYATVIGSQGNLGGAGTASNTGGGGGGAGAAGSNAVSTTGGNGGNGLANSITGSSVTRAGGGGGRGNGTGSTGGTGGGGNGGATGNGTNGTANTGGGGGGASGTGGSGILIIRVRA